MSNYLIDNETVGFLVKARHQTGELSQLGELLSAPREFADRYSLELSGNVEQKLLELGDINESKGYEPDDPINREIMSFYNKVLIDGRFLQEWAENPQNVADQLNINVSSNAIARIEELNFTELVNTELIGDPKQADQTALGIVIVIVLVIVFVIIPSCLTFSIQEVIVDPAAQDKV